MLNPELSDACLLAAQQDHTEIVAVKVSVNLKMSLAFEPTLTKGTCDTVAKNCKACFCTVVKEPTTTRPAKQDNKSQVSRQTK